MAETAPQQDVKVLFKQWRSGDPDAGVTMAQRFSDWYYAITVMRLGDQRARAPLEQACQIFAQRIMEVTNAEDLIDFAHRIVLDELQSAGDRSPGGDFPNGITGNQPPSQLLQTAVAQLSADHISVLHQTYARTQKAMDIHHDMPFTVLEARHALKRALAERVGVQFSVLPDSLDLDRGPLPLYEANQLRGNDEERIFEQWLLTDIDLCKDLAEFSAFAHALRAGALKDAGSGQSAPTPVTPITPSTKASTPRPVAPDLPTPKPDTGGGIPRGVLIGGGLVIALLAGAALLFNLMGG